MLQFWFPHAQRHSWLRLHSAARGPDRVRCLLCRTTLPEVGPAIAFFFEPGRTRYPVRDMTGDVGLAGRRPRRSAEPATAVGLELDA
jgi:hypothetical protein